jgi:hypothetical protein
VDASVAGVIVLTSTFGGALLGMWLRTVLPERYFDTESRDTVKVGIGLIATMTALVLGLITASAKKSLDDVTTAVKGFATQSLALDRTLARYGSETGEIRKALKGLIGTRIDMVWPQDPSKPVILDPLRVSGGEELAQAIRSLTPEDDGQRALQAQALNLTEALLQSRWIVTTSTGASVPLPFLAVLLFWLTITFTSFGLLASRNAMVVSVLLVCALSVASAVFLVLEMDGPFEGLLKVSADPLRAAHARLDQ